MEKLELKKGIELTVSNISRCRGHYYPEDDWCIEIIGDTAEEVIKKFWEEKYIKSEILIGSIIFNNIVYVTYNNENTVLDYLDCDTDLKKLYISQFDESPYREKALAEKKRLKEEAEEKRQQKYLKEKEERELKKLAELKAKYPDK